MNEKNHSFLYNLFYTVFFRPFPTAVSCCLFFLIPAVSFYLLETFTHNPFADINWMLQVFSCIFYILLYSIFFAAIGRMRLSFFLTTVILTVIGIANHYTLEFRSAPILPWDIRSLSIALAVTDNQSFTVPTSMAWTLAGFSGLLFLSLHCGLRFQPSRKRLYSLFMTAVLWIIMVFSVQTTLMTNVLDIYEMPFTQWYTYRQNGFMVSFFMNAKYLRIEKPSGYSPDTLEEDFSEGLTELMNWNPQVNDDIFAYGGAETDESAILPNIIVIMNEAFSDLSVLGDFETSEDYLPYFNSLTHNAINGSLYVSVLGGNTANTEFEFLTGDTMAFLPTGSIPYQQYCKSEMPSLAWLAKDQGYHTVAMHPYYDYGWNRDEVYNYFGFDEAYFLNDFKGSSRLRQYVSDQAMFQKIISLYQKKGSEPLFLFGVTMQNHGSYTKSYENFTPKLHVIDEKGYPWADAYLSLIRETDQAYRNLINYFTYVDEPTIILLFGDHQPTSLERRFFNTVMDADSSNLSLEQTVLRYQTPFKIWANYDIKEADGIRISANYLGSLLWQTAGLEFSDYQKYLSELHRLYPVITANFYYDSNGTLFEKRESGDFLSLYKKLQYNHIFDTKGRADSLFR